MPSRIPAAALLLCLLGLAACERPPATRIVPGPGTDRLPKTLAVHSLVANRLQEPRLRYDVIRPMGVEAAADRSRIALVPPAETDLRVTSMSQILTGEISLRLAEYGFDLRELPSEAVDSDEDGTAEYVISLDLLDELRVRSGVEAVLVGNAFFREAPGRKGREVWVLAAYLKVVDPETLEVLCQVSMPYDETGRTLDDVADSVARQLAGLAELYVAERPARAGP